MIKNKEAIENSTNYLIQNIDFYIANEYSLIKETTVKKIEDIPRFMEEHDEIADYYRGFKRYKIDDNIIRSKDDNIKIDKDNEKKSILKVGVASKILAASKLLKAHNVTLDEQSLLKIFNEYNSLIDKNPKSKNLINQLDYTLVELLKSNKIKNAKDELLYAIGFNSFEFKKKTIVSHQKINGLSYISIDYPLDFLENPEKEFKDINNLEWFKNLKPYKQKLVTNHLEQLKSNNHVLPKLLNEIPGLRNAFYKKNIIIHNDSKKIISNPDGNIHMANQVTEVKKNKSLTNDLTKQNLNYLQKIFQNKNIFLASLISPNKSIVNDENERSKITYDQKSEKTTYIPIAINLSSKSVFYSFKSQKKVIKFLEQLEENLKNKKNSNSSTEFSKLSNSIKGQANEISKFSFPKLFSIIKDFISYIAGGNFKENQHMELYSNLINIVDLYNKEIGENEQKYEVIINCKSGKDRTGLIQDLRSIKSLENDKKDFKYDNETIKSPTEENIIGTIKNSKQTLYINGSVYGGNSPGSHGILPQVRRIVTKGLMKYFDPEVFTKDSKNHQVKPKGPDLSFNLIKSILHNQKNNDIHTF